MKVVPPKPARREAQLQLKGLLCLIFCDVTWQMVLVHVIVVLTGDHRPSKLQGGLLLLACETGLTRGWSYMVLNR